MLTDRTASPPAWMPGYRIQACRSGEFAIGAEALMNNVGWEQPMSEGQLSDSTSRLRKNYLDPLELRRPARLG